MKKLLPFILLLASNTSLGFTLNNNFGASFKQKNVKVRIAGNTTCAGMRADELDALIKPAIDSFWNKVSTSSLRLKKGSYTEAIANIDNGFLCPPTDLDCINQGTTIPPVKDIVISCNNNSVNFSGSSSVLAVTVPNNFSSRSIVGAVILINDSSNIFSQLSHNEQISVISHEIGHAIGLGHSDQNSSLMYYRTVDHRQRLGQDDIDGVSYLYPMKMDACGILGTIEETKTPPFLTTLGALAIMVLLTECFKLLKRSKRITTF